MCCRNYDIINYIDDILGIDLPCRIDASFHALCDLLPQLGFEISQKKLVKPTTCLNCLGILVDTTFTLAIQWGAFGFSLVMKGDI